MLSDNPLQKEANATANPDIYDLDVTIARFVLPRLIDYRHTTDCSPATLSMQQWQGILDKMIYAFDKVANGTEFNTPEFQDYLNALCGDSDAVTKNVDLEQLRERAHRSQQPITEGLDLFHKYYRSLWC